MAIISVLAIGAAGLGGCDQRETNNPFIGPSGASTEMPFGRLQNEPSANGTVGASGSPDIGSTTSSTINSTTRGG